MTAILIEEKADMQKRQTCNWQPLGLCLGWTLAVAAQAHVSVTTSPIYAGKSAEIVLSVPHGCESSKYDTQRVEVEIPTELAGIRPADNVFGRAVPVTDTTGKVTRLVWSKPSDAPAHGDTHLYNFSFRATLPSTPFQTVYLDTTQYCKNDKGEEISVAWKGHGETTVTPAPEPAPSFVILPSRAPGWNKYTTNLHIHSLSIFKDAEIVWLDDRSKAYSVNAITAGWLAAEKIPLLEMIDEGQTFWVKY